MCKIPNINARVRLTQSPTQMQTSWWSQFFNTNTYMFQDNKVVEQFWNPFGKKQKVFWGAAFMLNVFVRELPLLLHTNRVGFHKVSQRWWINGASEVKFNQAKLIELEKNWFYGR